MISVDVRLARRDFALDVAFTGGGGVTALFGPSGCGKTTLIRLVAGLERPESGRIALGDRVLVDRATGTFLRPHARRIGLVFQDAQLFPHLSVAANLAYGRLFTPPARRRIDRDAVVEVLGIGHLLTRRPPTLSGGERQRVAIGRALLTSPDLLLMDEPLAALDEERKAEILPFVERLRDEFRIPILYVSHAVEEVARLASTVVRIDHGRVTAVGTPAEVLAPTAIPRATDRFDAVSLLTGHVLASEPDWGVTRLGHPGGELVLPMLLAASPRPVRVAVRAIDVTLARSLPDAVSTRSRLAGTVAHVAPGPGAFVHVEVALPGGDRLAAWVTRLGWNALALRIDDPVVALVKSVSIDERGISDRIA